MGGGGGAPGGRFRLKGFGVEEASTIAPAHHSVPTDPAAPTTYNITGDLRHRETEGREGRPERRPTGEKVRERRPRERLERKPEGEDQLN